MKRLVAAIKAFFQVLKTGEAPPPAAGPAAPEEPEAPAQPEPERETGGLSPVEAGAVQALALLQRYGRFVDFLMEDISAYDDAQVGAAVREIHSGCRKTLDEHFDVQAIMEEGEGARVAVEPGFDASRIRLSGRVSGSPPYSGTVVHRGWRVAAVRLPERSGAVDPSVIQPAEVEV